MRIPRLPLCLLILVYSLGCSQTGAFRSAGSSGSNVKTVASVGDKPLPIVAGEPGSSLRAEPDEPEPRATGSRVSGRVYNERGKPVPNAKVRLALSGAAGGKVTSATTDRSGAFTLHGLRPGASYTLIAEYEGNAGPTSGRAQVKAPQTDVRITLMASDDESSNDHASIRPARPRVEPISNVDPMDDEPAAEPGDAGRLNFEDIGPPAAEATSLRPEPDVQISRAQPPGDVSRSARSTHAGWTSRRDSKTAGAAKPVAPGDGGDAQSNDAAQAPANSRLGDSDDDGPNPLPPALEPAQVGVTRTGSRSESEPVRVARDTSRESARTPRNSRSAARRPNDRITTIDSDQAAGGEPKSSSEDVMPGEQVIKPGSYGPIRIGDPADASSEKPLPPTSRSRANSPAPCATATKPMTPRAAHTTRRAPPVRPAGPRGATSPPCTLARRWTSRCAGHRRPPLWAIIE